jgi:pyruvate dehydrogenase complex dehydrogenase (E1) component
MSIMMVAFIIFIFLLTNGPSVSKKMNHDRVKYLRDSLEMEYYKKQLESYPYDHSEIKDTTVIK